ncbi:T9SS type A sorting domain-containing protein [Epilithonimonas lactis]|uniref:Alpha integrin n=1 Tax=Epilithonimonas lactis TaxID=421072 RepID=A0A085BHQ7_9FLAO|nr:T9SS type A sorting domain-containing protein [Epilithonimonas lactis]KFC22002.1 alpha integrin [Epilithonimonas lactis]SEQ51377.1 Por secretion system C-terminal sorting domain-containing protein [Epilithonimonas lactis]
MKKFYISILALSAMITKAQSFEEVSQPALQNYFYSASAVADFDNDGFQDIFFTGAIDSDGDTNVDVTSNDFYKNTNGNFSSIQNFGDNSVHLSAVKFIDFDNDGLLDVVTTGLSYNDIVNYQQYRWKNTGSAFTLIDNAPGKIYGGLDVFDFSHDGKQDYAINGTQYIANVGFSQDLDLYTNNSNGFQKTEAWLPGTQNGSFKIVDLNNDNELDAVVNGFNSDYEGTFNIYINENGTLVQKSQLPPVSDSKMAFADFNGDGFLDFVVTGQDENFDSYLAVFTNDGQGNFTESKFEGEGLSAGNVEVGDLNNDGYYDFVVMGDDDNYDGYTNIYLYNPQLQKFEKSEDSGLYNLGSGGTLALFDYDNDGNLDILANGFDWADADLMPYTKLFRNTTTVSNQKPNAPTILTATENNNKINFSWSGASDDKTLENSLQYELTVGSEAGKSDIAKYIVTTKSWYLDKANLPSKIFWSVKAIDASKKYSDKSQEKEFSVLEVSDSKNEAVSIYPNPVKDVLNVKTASKIKTHKVYNLSGQVVSSKLISDKTIDFSRLEKGIYVLEIQLENGKKLTQKIIKN